MLGVQFFSECAAQKVGTTNRVQTASECLAAIVANLSKKAPFSSVSKGGTYL